ncbi:galactokinase [Dermacentor silvarum]|uniref:galactokinase n=1 Tax=Dermacentor silvarum TaxID=543639 RepID=UPI00189AFDEB|nr:galactokinase [Dermacentor silvarum]
MAAEAASAYPSVLQLAVHALRKFRTEFGSDPVYYGSAPGRVNLIGEHVDYCDGLVLPCAMPMYTVVVGSAVVGSSMCNVHSLSYPEPASFELPSEENPLKPGGPSWSNYVRGVVAHFPGRLRSGFNAVVISSVPAGAGLSSSAALEMAMFSFLRALLQPEELSDAHQAPLCCQKAEHEFAGVPCGIMDQMAAYWSKPGHALLLDCRSLALEHVPVNLTSVVILVTDSQVKHALTGGEYAQRRENCQAASAILGKSLRDASLEDLEGCRERMTLEQYRRARHVISEIQRTAQAAELLRKGDFRSLGELMNASHASLRDDFEVSCPELDELTRLSLESGAYGSRLTGAGFGGCTVTLVEEQHLTAVMDNIKNNYKGQARFYICKPSGGASYGRMSSLNSVAKH